MKKLIILMILFSAAPALADFTVQYSGASPYLGVNVTSSGNDGTFVTGQYKINIQGDAADIASIIGAPGVVDVFCIDLWDWAPTTSGIHYTLMPLDETPDMGAGPMGGDRAGYLATLLDTYWDADDWSSAASRTFDSTTYTANQVAAALQVAVWEIVDEFNTDPTGPEPITPAGWNVTTGSGLFYISGNAAVTAIANEMLSNVVTLGMSDFGNYRGVSNTTDPSHYQDYVVRVPVPAAVLLGLLGFGAAGIKLRKQD